MPARLLLTVLLVSTAAGQVLDTVIRFPRDIGYLFHVPAGNKLYVLNRGIDYQDYNIHVLDCSTMAVRAVIPVRSEFYNSRAAWCPLHDKVYYSSPALDTSGLLVIDNAADSTMQRLGIDVSERCIAYSRTSDKLYTAGWEGTITVLDCAADTVITTITPPDYTPNMIALWDSVGNKVYVGGVGWSNADRVTVLDCDTDSVLAVISTRIGGPCVGAYNPLRRKVYLGGDSRYGVCAIDCAGDTVVARFDSIWSREEDMPVYCSVEDKLYWPDHVGRPGTIHVIDCKTDSVVRRIPAPGGGYVSNMAYAEWSNRLYVASSIGAGLLTVFDCRTDSVIGQTRLGTNSPVVSEIVCNPIDQRIYVSVMWDSAVYVFRDELQPVEEQPGHGHPAKGIRVWPNPARGRVKLTVELRQHDRVSLSLYNTAGVRVKQLGSGLLAAGTYDLSWDATDESGRKASAGTYLAVLETSSGVVSSRVQLVEE